jgi:hypothetical protein
MKYRDARRLSPEENWSFRSTWPSLVLSTCFLSSSLSLPRRTRATLHHSGASNGSGADAAGTCAYLGGGHLILVSSERFVYLAHMALIHPSGKTKTAKIFAKDLRRRLSNNHLLLSSPYRRATSV